MYPLAIDLIDLLILPMFVPARVPVRNATVAQVRPEVRQVYDVDGLSDIEDVVSLGELEDRRRWDPEVSRPAGTVFGRGGRLSVSRNRLSGLRFSDSSIVVECSRRFRRRQVLFSRGIYGRVGNRRRRNSRFSGVSCE